LEPFKLRLGPGVVAELAEHLARVCPQFAARRFRDQALAGLDGLELKARVQHLAQALAAALPADFAMAADAIEAALRPPRWDCDLSWLATAADGLAGWPVWPLTQFVATVGLDHPDRGLRALHALTQRWSAEFALRPFLLRHRERTLAALAQWAGDPSPHVRRLCSEGSRPRLPWGEALPFLIEDPTPTLPLLLRLQDDPCAYVRRSVANHWNDIAKDHPALVADWLERCWPTADRLRQALCRHAARTLVKRGEPRVLAVFGCGAPFRGQAQLRLRPARPRIGESLELAVALQPQGRGTQRLVLDYVVRRDGASAAVRPKVWKGWQVELASGAGQKLRKRHALRQVTVRRLQPGSHTVELRANGVVVAAARFVLRPPDGGGGECR
jgi:3-methyladenine DNA glycosylase AlkC